MRREAGVVDDAAGARVVEQIFEFFFDVGSKIQVRQLQKLDRLHQLRRHDQRLALPEFELGEKRHGRGQMGKVGPRLACTVLRTRCSPAFKG